jgi:hypothetical protein
MQTNLAIQLSEHTFSVLASEASAAGKTPAELAADVVESVYAGHRVVSADADAANREFERYFGSIDMGLPLGIDNAQIDVDLGRAYGANSGS